MSNCPSRHTSLGLRGTNEHNSERSPGTVRRWGVGTALTGFLTAWYQRAERYRERLVDAAGEMLTASDEALRALRLYRRRTAEQFRALEVLNQARDALPTTYPVEHFEPNAEERLIATGRVVAAFPDFDFLTRGAFDEPLDEAMLEGLVRELQDAKGLLAEERATIPSAVWGSLNQALEAWDAFVPTVSEWRSVYRGWSEALDRLSTQVPRVVLLFTIRDRDASVRAALAITNALGKAMSVIHAEVTAGRDPNASDAVDLAFGNISSALGEFARAANRDIRRWRL